jgi:hypothetical protein
MSSLCFYRFPCVFVPLFYLAFEYSCTLSKVLSHACIENGRRLTVYRLWRLGKPPRVNMVERPVCMAGGIRILDLHVFYTSVPALLSIDPSTQSPASLA